MEPELKDFLQNIILFIIFVVIAIGLFKIYFDAKYNKLFDYTGID